MVGHKVKKSDDSMSLGEFLYTRGYKEGLCSDIAISAFDKTYRLHRIVLHRSPYFSSLLSGVWKESLDKPVQISFEDDHHITQEAFELAIARLYGVEKKGEEAKHLNGLIGVANFLGLQDLAEFCVTQLISNISTENVGRLVEFAMTYDYGGSSSSIIEGCKSFLCTEAIEMDMDLLDKVPASLMGEVLASDGFFVANEWQRCRFITKLYKHKVAKMSKERTERYAASKNAQEEAKEDGTTLVETEDEKDAGDERRSSSHDEENGPSSRKLDEKDETIQETDKKEEAEEVGEETGEEAEEQAEEEGDEEPSLDGTAKPAAEEPSGTKDDLEELIAAEVDEHVEDDEDEEIDPITGHYVSALNDLEHLRDAMNNGVYYCHLTHDQLFKIESLKDVYGKSLVDRTVLREGLWLQLELKQRIVASNASDAGLSEFHFFTSLEQSDITYYSIPSEGNAAYSNRYSKFPPFRFSVTFTDFSDLQLRERVYSECLWYAGSYWCVYVQKVPYKHNSTQLGVYLHRSENPEDKSAADSSRVASMSSGRNRRSFFTTSLRSPAPASMSNTNFSRTLLLSSDEEDETAMDFETRVEDEGPPVGFDEAPSLFGEPSNFPLVRRLNSPFGLQEQQRGSFGLYQTPPPPPPPPQQPRSRGSTPASSPLRSDSMGSSALTAAQLAVANLSSSVDNTASLLSGLRTIDDLDKEFSSNETRKGDYMDDRKRISAYFELYTPSRKGKTALTCFSSAPDVFEVSQSWGWKCASLGTNDTKKLKVMVVLGVV
ncbi:hypothetical protein TRVA0_028S01486 [Trichomonascus vanleenenianus]|uniref:uncharacterized protein n=1 Tax=Trichomonascus vanleenenianus TaxID=2268995 RepID=UPI003EC9D7C3